MTRNLKGLALTLVAAFAVSAVAVSAASAAPVRFTFGAGTVEAQGEQSVTNELRTDTGLLKCTNTHFGAEVFNESEITLVPTTYVGCKLVGLAATITPNGCYYLFTAGEWFGTRAEGSVHIKCPAKQVIEIKGPECTITIAEQTPTEGTITYTNSGGATGNEMDILIDLGLLNIHYVEHGEFCATNQTETTTNGVYTGNITLRGYDKLAEQVNLTVS